MAFFCNYCIKGTKKILQVLYEEIQNAVKTKENITIQSSKEYIYHKNQFFFIFTNFSNMFYFLTNQNFSFTHCKLIFTCELQRSQFAYESSVKKYLGIGNLQQQNWQRFVAIFYEIHLSLLCSLGWTTILDEFWPQYDSVVSYDSDIYSWAAKCPHLTGNPRHITLGRGY